MFITLFTYMYSTSVCINFNYFVKSFISLTDVHVAKIVYTLKCALNGQVF